MSGRRISLAVLLSCLVAVVVPGSTQSAGSSTARASRGPEVVRSAGAPLSVPVTKKTTTLKPSCGAHPAWIGSNSDGVSCLDTAGWKLFDEKTPFPGPGFVKDIAVCRNGAVWMAGSSGFVSTTGRSWTSYKPSKNMSFDAVACDAKGRVWLAGYNTVVFYNGKTLTVYPVAKLGTGKYVNQLKDVAVGPDGRVWFATANSIAAFNGSRWTVFENGHGFDKQYSFGKLAIGGDGHVWATTGSDVLSYDGHAWTSVNSEYWQGQALAVDGRNRLWVGTYAKGVAVYDGQSWTMYDRTNSGLPSNKVKSLAVDAKGRVWIGTEWGLAVLAGSNWASYHVADSNIPANEVTSLGLVRGGPTLPGKLSKKPGSLKGRLVRSGKPQSGLRVELCVEQLGMFMSGETPCASQPFHRETTTGGDGSFAFGALPAGDYVIAFQDENGKWYVLSSTFGLGSSSQEVLPGKTTDIGELDLAEST